MKTYKLHHMKGGWFIGNFSPACFKSEAFEVACKFYQQGDVETAHVHTIATEVTLICQGEVRMNNVKYVSGDIIVLEPGEITDFEVIEKTITMVIKIPSVIGDKYLV